MLQKHKLGKVKEHEANSNNSQSMKGPKWKMPKNDLTGLLVLNTLTMLLIGIDCCKNLMVATSMSIKSCRKSCEHPCAHLDMDLYL